MIAHCDGQLMLQVAKLGAGYTDYDGGHGGLPGREGLGSYSACLVSQGKVGPGQALGQEFAGGPSEHEDYCH